MFRIMRIKGTTAWLFITLGILSLLLIPSSARMIANIILDKAVIAYGQVNKINSSLTNPIAPENIPLRKVHVGDIDIAYKIFGNGNPILLIAGTSATMDFWDPFVLRQLSANHTVIVFDNRGMGNTSSGNRPFSISQFANDTAGLLDALKITKPVDVLAHSLGTFVAQELALMHPEKVNKLVLFASNCGGREAIPATPEATKNMTELSKVGEQSKQYPSLIASLLFPKKWMEENPNYLQKLKFKETVSLSSLQRQIEAGYTWKGSCDRLGHIKAPTLVIVGSNDIVTPPTNSLILSQKIPGAWLVQVKGGGHGLIYQYPDEFSRIVLTFLET